MSNIKTLKTIAILDAGKNQSIKVNIVLAGKDTYCDIRTWIDSGKYTGPTKKGIWLDWDTLNEIVNDRVLEKAITAMDSLAAPRTGVE